MDLAELERKQQLSRRTKFFMSIGGLFIALLAYGLAWHWFGFRLALILFLLNWTINIEQRLRRG